MALLFARLMNGYRSRFSLERVAWKRATASLLYRGEDREYYTVKIVYPGG
jgi:hypothetical protein